MLSTTPRTAVRKRPVTPTVMARRSLAAAARELSTLAAVTVTDTMMAASRIVRSGTASRPG